MQFINALRYSHPSSVAFVGAGGKTTAIFRAARELLAVNVNDIPIQTVLVTTTTHFGAWQIHLADQVLTILSLQDIEKLDKQFPKGVVLLTGGEMEDRLVGLTPVLLNNLYHLAIDHHLPLLIEADGSRSRPLKAPATHEPAIPDFIQQVVVVAGLSGIGKPLSNKWVHHPEKLSELTGLQLDEVMTGTALEKLLLSNEGGLKNIPTHARKTALLNQSDTPDLQSQAKVICEKLLPVYQSAIIASLSRGNDGIATSVNQKPDGMPEIQVVFEQTGGVILAAGGSSRFGKPKQLVMWRGIPLIRHVAINALNAGLSPVVVVVGSSSDEIQSAIEDLSLRIVNNLEWQKGISSSLKVGLKALSGEVGGVVFLQADQPQLSPSLIKNLIEAHQVTFNPIIGPLIDGQRGNPVLFDADTFTDLQAIEGDIGGRALFSRYPVEWLIWHDANLLMDIDSPEDYQRFLDAYPESEVEP